MKTRKQNTQLVQTRVTKATERKLVARAEQAGMTIAGYLRVLILAAVARQDDAEHE